MNKLGITKLKDSIIPDGALDKVKISILGLSIELKTYFNLLGTLGVGGFRDQDLSQVGAINYGKDHFTCFQFDYDWRKSNVYNAQELSKFVEEKKLYIQKEYEKKFGIKNYDVKFNIIAHSMGGLLTRYFLRYGNQDLPKDGSLPELTWSGTENVNKVFLIGTPNGGSVYSLNDLINGKKLAPVIPHYHAGILGTLPAVYELMPRTRHGAVFTNVNGVEKSLDIFDIQLWSDNGWGLLDPEQEFILKWILPDVESKEERREIAKIQLKKYLDHTKQFHKSLDLKASPPPNSIKINAIAGDSIKTFSRLEVLDNGKVKFKGKVPGDGLVTRTSVLLDERVGNEWKPFLPTPIHWDNVLFLFTDHVGLTKSPIFADNILHSLLEAP